MLLSYDKRAQATSSLDGLTAQNAFDEDIRTYWSARSEKPGEWLSVNLGKPARIEAVQVNFAEHEATARGRSALYHQYRLERSMDGKTWEILADRSANRADVPHDYLPLPAPVIAQFVRLTNVNMPGGGTFSIRDLSIFIFCLLTPVLVWPQQANVNLDYNPQKNTENLIPFSATLNSPDVHDD